LKEKQSFHFPQTFLALVLVVMWVSVILMSDFNRHWIPSIKASKASRRQVTWQCVGLSLSCYEYIPTYVTNTQERR
jgi:uncharacterized membrane protein (DUF485 family)